ncbi:MAG TPA: diacylglycerol kinase family protein [Candidatus Bathyarchaeia archaeon]|nr:diacylglycerol kinase family protein [Candidatus Bathyarchaeia archaeon]
MAVLKTLVIVNPASSAGGTGRRQGEILAALECHFGRGFSLVATKGPGHATASSRDAVHLGIELVIAVGGDGTLQEVVNGLMQAGGASGRRPQLGIINAGTGHGFAQGMRLPESLDAQCAGIACGSFRRVDIGRAAFRDRAGRPVERYFVNECQAGIGGRVVDKVQAGHKRLGGRLGFGLATLTTALTFPNRAMRFSLDDGPEQSGSFVGVVAANSPSMAGGMKLAPRAALDDGALDILLMSGQTLPERLRNFPKIYSGTHLESPKFASLRGRTLSLASDVPVSFEADGEPFGDLPCRIEIVPAALEVRTDELGKG